MEPRKERHERMAYKRKTRIRPTVVDRSKTKRVKCPDCCSDDKCCPGHLPGEATELGHSVPAPKTKRKLDASDIATLLAALRLFQRTYENLDADAIYAEWPEHFTDDDGEMIMPLGSEDIDRLCEEINCGEVEL